MLENQIEYLECECGYQCVQQEVLDCHQETCHFGQICELCNERITSRYDGVVMDDGEIQCDACWELEQQDGETGAFDQHAPVGYELGLRGEN